MRVLFLAGSIILAGNADAQNIATNTLIWEAERVTEVEKTVSRDFTCTFTSDKGKTLTWTQRKGRQVTTFNIVSVSGSWKDIDDLGAVTYGLERNGNLIKAVFERTSEGYYVTLDFSKPEEYSSTLKFKIKNVSK